MNINEFQGLALNWLALMVGVWVLGCVLRWFGLGLGWVGFRL